MKTMTYAHNPTKPQNSSFGEVYEVIANEQLENSEFIDLTIAGALISLSVFKGLTFRDCVFYGTRFENCTFIDCKFENCSFQFSQIDYCNFQRTQFQNCQWDFTRSQSNQWTFCRLDSRTLKAIADLDKNNDLIQCSASTPSEWDEVLAA